VLLLASTFAWKYFCLHGAAMVVVRTDLSDRADSEVEIPVIIAGGRQPQTATMCTGHGGENSV
jgi:hypothetical protein